MTSYQGLNGTVQVGILRSKETFNISVSEEKTLMNVISDWLQNMTLGGDSVAEDSLISSTSQNETGKYVLDDLLSPKDILTPALSENAKTVFLVLYILIIVLAVLGNLVVIGVVGTSSKLRTVTNAFLVSLAVSDLLIATVNMPLQLLFLLRNEWTLGSIACKLTNYIQGVTVVVSILTLTGMAVDRYYAICHPLRVRHVHTLNRAVFLLASFWVVSMVMLIPQLFIQRLEPLLHMDPQNPIDIRFAYVCVEYFGQHYLNIMYTMVFYVLLYLLPVVIMLITYGKIAYTLWFRQPIGESPANARDQDKRLLEKKRIVRMLVVIVVMFALSWFPFFTNQIYMLFVHHHVTPNRLVVAILQVFGYSNSCTNPIVYCFLNESFKQNFIKSICHHLRIVHRQQYSIETDKMSPSPTTINNTTL